MIIELKNRDILTTLSRSLAVWSTLAGKEGALECQATAWDFLSRFYKTAKPDVNFNIDKENILVAVNNETFGAVNLTFFNLYTFVLCHGIYVPYYDWVYSKEFQHNDMIYYYDTMFAEYRICTIAERLEQKRNEIDYDRHERRISKEVNFDSIEATVNLQKKHQPIPKVFNSKPANRFVSFKSQNRGRR